MIDAPLKSLCQIRHGGTPSKANAAYWEGTIPWISPKDMKSSILTDARDHISPQAVQSSAACVVPEKSILVVVRSGILAHSVPVAQAARPLAFNQDIKALIPDDAKVDPDYLFWFMRSQESRVLALGVKKGATVHSLHSGFIENLHVPLPERDRQRRVVDLLSRAEGIVRLRREAEQKAAELVPALFTDMFGDPATNPKVWSCALLGDLIANGPQNGLYKHASFYGDGAPILRIDAFYDGRVRDLRSLRRVQVTDEEIGRFGLAHRDIVINRVNSPEYLGKSAIIPPLDEPTVFESNMMRFGLNEDVALPEFLIELLQTAHARSHFLSKAKHAINQSSINQQDVKSLRVPIPPLDRQRSFALRVEEIMSIRGQQAAATTKAQAAFDALLSRTFASA